MGCAVEADICAGEQRQRFVVQLTQYPVEMDSVSLKRRSEARDLYNSFRAGDIKTGTGEKNETARKPTYRFKPLGVV